MISKKGFLIYCYDNGAINYGIIALCNALLIKKHCVTNNVALVTNSSTLENLSKKYNKSLINYAFDNVICNESKDDITGDRRFFDTRYSNIVGKYINGNRHTAYDLSPFDETILIDADYLILDSTTDLVWDINEDFLCNSITKDLDNRYHTIDTGSRLNDMGVPLYWATMVYFKKTTFSKILFDHISYIKENYEFYKCLYNFESSPFFRNDYAFSISLHILNGFYETNNVKSFPVDYIKISNEFDVMHDFINGTALITSEPEQGKFNLHKISNNVHVMNKQNIVRNSEKIIDYATK